MMKTLCMVNAMVITKTAVRLKKMIKHVRIGSRFSLLRFSFVAGDVFSQQAKNISVSLLAQHPQKPNYMRMWIPSMGDVLTTLVLCFIRVAKANTSNLELIIMKKAIETIP